ncbi:hypothetical protein MKZ17_19190 [Solibacillus sp. FSL R7-0682]|uniref:hypothetical protein n=1 Tax=Solibacillus sp. FSL R7-0682 TaxID=2921690 RepID=UPI0030F79938
MKRSVITFVSFFMVLSLFLVSPSKPEATSLEPISGSFNLDDLELMEEKGEVIVEELTYEEFIQERAADKGISITEARKMYKNPYVDSKGTQLLAANSYFMLKINIIQDVGFFYKPAITVYAWTYTSNSFREMKYIEEVVLDRDGVNDSYTAKGFEGKIRAKLTTSTSVWWLINGDFYHQGEMTFTGGIGGTFATIGKEVQLNGSVTRKIDHYTYFDDDGTHYIY